MRKDGLSLKLYSNRTVVLLTKHGKENVIKPIFESETGCTLITLSGYDTDKLGTFSREIKRLKSQLGTARMKVKKAMKLAKADIGLASEGSFGSHPIAMLPWNIELVLLFDKKEKLEIFGVYESADTNFSHKTVDHYEALCSFAERIGFPSHFLILRPDNEHTRYIIKDINCYETLKDAYQKCKLISKTGMVFVETDMRAHANPTRMKNIQRATENLISKLLCFCPSCNAPGFAIEKVVRGLPCASCGMPTESILKNIYTCYRCRHSVEAVYPFGTTSPPEYCDYCNP